MNAEDTPLPGRQFLDGAVLLVDKPKEWTSFDVVNKIRYRLKHLLGVKKIKVGHAGTLDPMATGLLILCTGKFTKKLEQYQGLPKEYTGTFMLGSTTPSYDSETEISEHFPVDHIDLELLNNIKAQFLGDIEQIPPMFSAIKVDGQPLYKKARKGQMVEVKPRPVHIYDFEITRFEGNEVDFRISCSKGTYIRSIAHDFGKALRSGAYLSALTRTKIGTYALQDAWNLEALVEHLEEQTKKV